MNKKTNQGFTIFELLVCIMVINVLAALLFSGLQQSRNKARMTTCINNQRNITGGVLMYALDHDTFPENLTAMNTNLNQQDHSQSDFWNINQLAYASNATPYFDGMFNDFVCPETQFGKNSASISYGMNQLIQNVNYSQISAPSKIIVVADGMDDPLLASSDTVAYRHNGYALAGFVDGHVEMIKPGNLYNMSPQFGGIGFTNTGNDIDTNFNFIPDINEFEESLENLDPFDLEDGGVILNGDYSTQIHPLLAQLSYGGYYWNCNGKGSCYQDYFFDFMDMYLDLEVTSPEGETTMHHVTDPDGEGLDGWMSADDMSAFEYTSEEAFPAGSEINVIATAKWWLPQYTVVKYHGQNVWQTTWIQQEYKSYNTNDDLNSQVFVLKDGDPVPNIPGFYDAYLDEQQTSIAEAIAQYTVTDAEGNMFIDLEEDQTIYFFEISHTPDQIGQAGYDGNDLIFIMDLET